MVGYPEVNFTRRKFTEVAARGLRRMTTPPPPKPSAVCASLLGRSPAPSCRFFDGYPPAYSANGNALKVYGAAARALRRITPPHPQNPRVCVCDYWVGRRDCPVAFLTLIPLPSTNLTSLVKAEGQIPQHQQAGTTVKASSKTSWRRATSTTPGYFRRCRLYRI